MRRESSIAIDRRPAASTICIRNRFRNRLRIPGENEMREPSRTPDRRPTINDIAKRAGLSKASVSRALDGKQGVDPGTRNRVLHVRAQEGKDTRTGARAPSTAR